MLLDAIYDGEAHASVGERAWRVALWFLLVFSPLAVTAQPWPDRGADAVEQFIPGSGQTTGRGSEYFPHNVLGRPDTSARFDVATVDPVQILSLGLGGEIVLRFDRNLIVDGPGSDFTVFENAFRYRIGGKEKTYAEPGEIAVSRDGITFVPFPFDSLTLLGCAGVTPTNGDHDPTDPVVSGGDSFDLADIGIDSVRYVRIRDITSMVLNNREHPFWDATLSGFDLDAVVAVNVAAPSSAAVGERNEGVRNVTLRPNPAHGIAWIELTLDRAVRLNLRLFDLLGREVLALDRSGIVGTQRLPLDLSVLGNGAYLLRVDADGTMLRTLPLHIMQ